MNSSRIACFLLVVLTGCATSQQSKFSEATVQQLSVGTHKERVLAVLGEPRSRSLNNQQEELWQYRKNGQQGKGVKAYSDIMSFGLTRGVDAEYQDILTITFQSNVVSKVTYQENVRMLEGLGQSPR